MSNKIINNINHISTKSKNTIKNLKEMEVLSEMVNPKKKIIKKIKKNMDEEFDDDGKMDYIKTINYCKIKNKIDEDSSINSIKDLSDDEDEFEDIQKFNNDTNIENSIKDLENTMINEEEENDESTTTTFTNKKGNRVYNKIEYKFNKIDNINKYFEYLSNIENKNGKLENYIGYMHDIINERKIKDLNQYLKNLSAIINNYKMIFGYIIYIKEYDTRTTPEILDLLNIISRIIHTNTAIIDQSGYFLLAKKNLSKIIDEKQLPIKFINSETINDITLFTPEIKQDSFCYLNKYIILVDVINTFMISWYLIFLHLEICKNIIGQDETEIKKIRDKCLTISLDTNIYTKPYITFIKRKPKNNTKDTEKVKSKVNKASNIILGESLKKMDLTSNDINESNDLSMNDIDE